MSIAVKCASCQWSGNVSDDLAGKKGRCPKCKNVIPIPAVDSQPEFVDDDVVDDGFEVPPKKETQVKKKAKLEFVDDEEEEDRPSKKSRKKSFQSGVEDDDDEYDGSSRSRSRRDDRDDYDDRPRKKKRKSSEASSEDGQSPAGLIFVGLLMIVGAIVWFVLGLMNDRIFFYPPILLVLGIISLFKGLMGNSE